MWSCYKTVFQNLACFIYKLLYFALLLDRFYKTSVFYDNHLCLSFVFSDIKQSLIKLFSLSFNRQNKIILQTFYSASVWQGLLLPCGPHYVMVYFAYK